MERYITVPVSHVEVLKRDNKVQSTVYFILFRIRNNKTIFWARFPFFTFGLHGRALPYLIALHCYNRDAFLTDTWPFKTIHKWSRTVYRRTIDDLKGPKRYGHVTKTKDQLLKIILWANKNRSILYSLLYPINKCFKKFAEFSKFFCKYNSLNIAQKSLSNFSY